MSWEEQIEALTRTLRFIKKRWDQWLPPKTPPLFLSPLLLWLYFNMCAYLPNTQTHTHTPTLDIMLFPHKKRLSHYWFLSRMVGKKRRGWDWKRRMLSSNVKQPPHTHTSICSVSFPLITPFHLSPATLIIITLVGKIKLVGLNLPSCPRNGTDHQLKGGTGVSRRQKR